MAPINKMNAIQKNISFLSMKSLQCMKTQQVLKILIVIYSTQALF